MPAAQSCPWSTNHLACVNAWAFLRGLGQFRQAFNNAKDIKMSEFAFWNPAASAAQRRLEAEELAAQLDRIYRRALMAKYEAGFDFAKATASMTATLTKSGATLCQLAVVIDSAYNFRGEIS